MINVYTTELEKKFANEAFAIAEKSEYDVLRIRASGYRNRKKCQIMIERIDEKPVTISDCEKFNQLLLLRKSNFIDDYAIEISSPGINKPLTRVKDYTQNLGMAINLTTVCKVDNRRRFRGIINKTTENSVQIKLFNTEENINIGFEFIAEAFLDVDNF